jgi:lipopolysaccharide transport system permease protein
MSKRRAERIAAATAGVVAIHPAEPFTVGCEPLETIVIEARKGWQALDLAELWRYRELLWFLAGKSIKIRYKQTLLGAAWAVIQPVLTMVVFSIFFGGLAKVPSDGFPYPLFTFCALLPWQLFCHALTQSGNSLVNEQRLISKVYFPRLIVPLASVLSAAIDFAIAFVVLLGMMAWYGVYPGWAAATLPLFVVLAMATALSVGLWLSALNVHYRDFRYTIPFLTQFWMFLTPVAYPSSLVPEQWRWLYGLNPMAGVVEGFRWALLGNAHVSPMVLATSAVTVALSLVGGLIFFRQTEKTFADVI